MDPTSIGEAGILARTRVESAPGWNDSRFLALLLALAAAALAFGVVMRLQPVTGSNDGSRWNTAWALAHGRGYIIDDAPYYSIDKVRRDGHYYSSKPPLMPTLLAAPVWLLERAGIGFPERSHIVVRLLLLLVNVVPLALFVVLYGRWLERAAPGFTTALICLFTAAFGTYLTAFSTVLNNHTQAAISAFIALYCLMRIHYDGRRQWYYFALCGLFTAWTVASEMVALVFALLVLGWLLRTHPRPTLKYFLPVTAVLGAAYLYTTWIATGSLIPYYVRFDSEYYRYPGSYWSNPRGIDAAQEPKWFYAFNLLLGHHGIFSLTPIFLLAFYGMWKDRRLRAIHAMGLGLTALMFIFYTFKTNNYGGVAQGARWLFWLIPFWLLGLPAALERHRESRRFRAAALLLLAVSVFSVGYAMAGHRDTGRPGPWSPPWLQIVMRDAGLIPY
jgi:hypothetical protein